MFTNNIFVIVMRCNGMLYIVCFSPSQFSLQTILKFTISWLKVTADFKICFEQNQFSTPIITLILLILYCMQERLPSLFAPGIFGRFVIQNSSVPRINLGIYFKHWSRVEGTSDPQCHRGLITLKCLPLFQHCTRIKDTNGRVTLYWLNDTNSVPVVFTL